MAISYQMPTMTKEETASYIKHHITIAGRGDTLFSDDAVELIHLTSRGLPRWISNIAWQSLIAAFTRGEGHRRRVLHPHRHHRDTRDRVTTKATPRSP
ncbi:hypothetical protein [Streptomyces sp. NPDC056296]|uniref:hypothetical protein n=1 Tax=Streptomyces sp. NPDC056296 TaxID=3345775 RepID=UPI0035E30F57